MTDLNDLLVRQIRHHLGDPQSLPAELAPLIDTISQSYDVQEGTRAALERALAQNPPGGADAARAAEEELQNFASVTAHHFTEPLRSIAGFLQLLARRDAPTLSPQGKEYLQFSIMGVHQMQRMLEGLLNFAQIDAVHANPAPVDTRLMIQDVCVALQKKIEASQAEVLASDLPALHGDRALLTRLFQNLIENSLKFRSQDPPRIEIVAEPAENGYVRFSFTDNGLGIPEGDRERAFAIFQRLHSRDRYEGAGMGLPICKRIVELHGGVMWIDPACTTGMRMIFELPEAVAPLEVIVEAPAEAPAPPVAVTTAAPMFQSLISMVAPPSAPRITGLAGHSGVLPAEGEEAEADTDMGFFPPGPDGAYQGRPMEGTEYDGLPPSIFYESTQKIDLRAADQVEPSDFAKDEGAEETPAPPEKPPVSRPAPFRSSSANAPITPLVRPRPANGNGDRRSDN